MPSSPGNPAMHIVVIVMPMSISDFNTVIVYSFGWGVFSTIHIPQQYHPIRLHKHPTAGPHTPLHAPYSHPSIVPTGSKIGQNKHRDKPPKTCSLFKNCKLLTSTNENTPPQNELYSRIKFIPTHHQPPHHTPIYTTLQHTHTQPSTHPANNPNTPPTTPAYNHPNTKNKNPTKTQKEPASTNTSRAQTKTKNYPDKQQTATKLLTTPTTHTTSSPNTEPLR